MALTKYQGEILELLAARRIERQESYLAGGAALTQANRLASALARSRSVPRYTGGSGFHMDRRPRDPGGSG